MKVLTYFKIILLGIIFSINLNLSAAEMNKQISLDIKSSNKLIYIRNLAGNVEIKPSPDDQIHIRGQINAEANTTEEAKKLLQLISLDTQQTRNQTIISVAYPVDMYEGFIYIPNKNQDSWRIYNQAFNYMGEKVNLTNRYNKKTKDWAKVYTDLSIELPKSQWNKVNVIAGDIKTIDLNGESTINVDKGDVLITNSTGDLNIYSDQGPVDIQGHTGALRVETGYGDITGNNINGDIDARTRLSNININKLNGNISANSGFGTVTVNKLIKGKTVDLTTDRGDIRLNGNLLTVKDLNINTKNGDIKIISTHTPSLKFNVETKNGEINFSSPEMVIRKQQEHRLLANIGNAKGKASIETNKGNVNFFISDDLDSEIEKYAKKDREDNEKKQKMTRDSRLAAMVRIALSRNQNLQNANFKVTANDGIVSAKGDLDTKAEIVTAMEIIMNVKGVKEASVSSENTNLK